MFCLGNLKKFKVFQMLLLMIFLIDLTFLGLNRTILRIIIKDEINKRKVFIQTKVKLKVYLYVSCFRIWILGTLSEMKK